MTTLFAVTNGTIAAAAEEKPGFPPITGKPENVRFWDNPEDAQAMADRLNRIPNVRGGFVVKPVVFDPEAPPRF